MVIRTRSKGFSLIEVMIVVAITGILMGIAIPSYKTYIKKAKMAGVMSIVNAFKVDITDVYMKDGSFPHDIFALGGSKFPYRTNVYYPSLGPNITQAYWANDPTSPTGRPKATIEFQLTPELGSVRIYYVAIVNNGAIEFHCGTWLQSWDSANPSYLPSTCTEQNLMNL